MLFDDGNRCKIADLGLSRHCANPDSSYTVSHGALNYMAPERKNGEPVPYRSDIYSLGIILHYMLTKKLPVYSKHIEKGVFEVSSTYSIEIYQLLC